MDKKLRPLFIQTNLEQLAYTLARYNLTDQADLTKAIQCQIEILLVLNKRLEGRFDALADDTKVDLEQKSS